MTIVWTRRETNRPVNYPRPIPNPNLHGALFSRKLLPGSRIFVSQAIASSFSLGKSPKDWFQRPANQLAILLAFIFHNSKRTFDLICWPSISNPLKIKNIHISSYRDEEYRIMTFSIWINRARRWPRLKWCSNFWWTSN
jgi:hypothetical protein